MFVVADTSVYVSALVFGGIPQTALKQAMRRPYRLAASQDIKLELSQTLGGKFDWPADRIAYAVEQLWREALWCEPVTVQASRDPNDDHILGCALAAAAQALISGDKDLLALHPFRGILIVTPAQFLASVSDRGVHN